MLALKCNVSKRFSVTFSFVNATVVEGLHVMLFHWYSWTKCLTQIVLFCCALTLKLQMNSSAGGELDLLVISCLGSVSDWTLFRWISMVASHATGQDDDKITFGVETFHHSKCWFFNMAVTNINDGNHILVQTLVTMIKICTNDVEEQFWIIVIQKREIL